MATGSEAKARAVTVALDALPVGDAVVDAPVPVVEADELLCKASCWKFSKLLGPDSTALMAKTMPAAQ